MLFDKKFNWWKIYTCMRGGFTPLFVLCVLGSFERLGNTSSCFFLSDFYYIFGRGKEKKKHFSLLGSPKMEEGEGYLWGSRACWEQPFFIYCLRVLNLQKLRMKVCISYKTLVFITIILFLWLLNLLRWYIMRMFGSSQSKPIKGLRVF